MTVDPSDETTDVERSILYRRWYAVPNDLIGGWSITTIDVPLSSLDGAADWHVGDFLTERIARHVVDLHERWFDGESELHDDGDVDG